MIAIISFPHILNENNSVFFIEDLFIECFYVLPAVGAIVGRFILIVVVGGNVVVEVVVVVHVVRKAAEEDKE